MADHSIYTLTGHTNPTDLLTLADGQAVFGVGGSAVVSVKDALFGAKGDSDITGATGTDDTAAIQAAIDYLNGLGGGTLRLPGGFFKISSYLTPCHNLTVVGDGINISVIVQTAAGGGGANAGQSLRNGSAFFGNSPSNSSVGVWVRLEKLRLHNSNPANVGAGYYDNGGTYFWRENVRISGFRHCVAYDQTELGWSVECIDEPVGGYGVYIVDGPTLTPGNLSGFTNVIGYQDGGLNGTSGGTLVKCEGCYTLALWNNNYNGADKHFDLKFAQYLSMISGESEGAAHAPATFETCFGHVESFLINQGGDGTSPVTFVGGNGLSFDTIQFGGPAYPFTGVLDQTISIDNCTSGHASGEFAASQTYGLHDTGITTPVKTNFGGAAWNLDANYANGIVLCTNATANAATILSDANSLRRIGTQYTLEQTAGAGVCSFVAGAGVTITGPLTTNGVGQRLTARKIAANTWETELVLRTPQAAAMADLGAAPTQADFNALLAKLRTAQLMAP